MIRMFRTAAVFILSLPVYLYRYTLSHWIGSACRHVPTCSRYMLDALRIHGPVIGLLMGAGRIIRCRPGGTHGYDPVPMFRFKRYRPLYAIFHRWERENRLKR